MAQGEQEQENKGEFFSFVVHHSCCNILPFALCLLFGRPRLSCPCLTLTLIPWPLCDIFARSPLALRTLMAPC